MNRTEYHSIIPVRRGDFADEPLSFDSTRL